MNNLSSDGAIEAMTRSARLFSAALFQERWSNCFSGRGLIPPLNVVAACHSFLSVARLNSFHVPSLVCT